MAADTAFALASMDSFLMHSTDGTEYTKFMDIKSIPDLGGTPDQIEATTLTDHKKKYVEGLQDTGSLEFTANYTAANYSAAKAIDDAGTSDHWAVYIGATAAGVPDGHNGIFKFTGTMSVMKSSADVGAVQEMKMTITLGSDITFTEGA